ncbi:MAG: hypothetical protein NC102_02305 [Clostridium sp.]|nr:hypothetical protein [Clostridium sp.]
MKLKSLAITLLAVAGMCAPAHATNLTVKMNSVSTTMSLTPLAGGDPVQAGDPSNNIYKFDVEGGDYLLTAYAKDGTTVNGTMEVYVDPDSVAQQLTVLTLTAYASNKNWVVDEDYTIRTEVHSREGKIQKITMGNSVTAGRKTFLALNGNTYLTYFDPSEEHVKEGYTTLFRVGTLTGNINISGAIPLGGDFSITAPKDAGVELNIKRVHFSDFEHIEPKSVEPDGNNLVYTYYLAQGQVYNFRTWKEGGLTQAAQFTYSAKEEDRPVIVLTDADYQTYDPTAINHSPQSNSGYETGDILTNAPYQGFISMKSGETRLSHCMRMWELTDDSSNNYFFEPDYHYTVLDLDGKPSTNVVEVIEANPNTSSWATLKAKGKGTAIVLVTYDGIQVDTWNKTGRSPYLGGEFWGAIWPENTAAFVVAVDEGESAVKPNMVVNQAYNQGALKMSGDNVDAEHDVFYYLDTEEGANYTFTPEGAASVALAYPTIGDRMATYTGFSSEGVTANEDGSYTLLLKEGRHIVKLTDASGNSTYQVIRGRKCHREITNVTRPGSQIFQPGDQIKIQYSGLYHPANKIAGIYNMSAYVTYNGTPNGTSLILGSGQYTFGSVAKAQAVDITIAADHDVQAQPQIEMTEGVIQVNGYGDPIGNHRNIDPICGRSPNFTAVPHKTYFGALPDVAIPLSAVKNFEIKLNCNVEDAEIKVAFLGKDLEPGENGIYEGTYGDYSVVASKKGYRCFRHTFNIPDDAEGMQTFNIEMIEDANSWDGQTLTEPALVDGVYSISNGAELAWFANHVASEATASAVLTDDIELGAYDWNAIGATSSKPFSGTFDGKMHTVNGLYINQSGTQYLGLFGYLKGSAANVVKISNVAVSGQATVKSHGGGLAGYATDYVEIDRCSNSAAITGGSNLGGIVGYITGTHSKITNCYNTGDINGTGNTGGIVGGHTTQATVIENVFNTGELVGNYVGGCVGSSMAKPGLKNAYTLGEYVVTTGQTTVTEEEMESGAVAYLLGAAFGQEIGTEKLPIIGGAKVHKVTYTLISDEAMALNNDEAELYTNGLLPATIDGEEAHWYADAEMTSPVTTIESDADLFLKLGALSGVEGIEMDVEGPARWFNIQGIEVAEPAPGSHGIFIKISNGKSQKIRL